MKKHLLFIPCFVCSSFYMFGQNSLTTSEYSNQLIPSSSISAVNSEITEENNNSFTKVWTRCVADENKPAWMGTDTERGIAYANKHLYVVSRANKVNSVKILNAKTGEDIGDLKLTSVVTGGAFAINDVETSDDNQILVANMTTNASTIPFKIYRWKDESSEPELFLTYTAAGAYRIGDNFTVKGDLSKDAVIYAAVSTKNIVYRWMVKNGILDKTPTEIIVTLRDSKMGACGSVAPYGITENDNFILNGNALTPMECKQSGDTIGRINSSYMALLSGGMKLFEYNGGRYLFCSQFSASLGKKDSQSSILINLTGCSLADVTESQIYGFTPILGTTKNANSAGDVCVGIDGNDVILYTLGANNGISAYRPAGLIPSSVSTAYIEPALIAYPNPAAEYIKIQAADRIAVVRIFDMQGHLIMQKSVCGLSDMVNVSALSKDLYIVEVMSDNQSKVQKMTLGK